METDKLNLKDLYGFWIVSSIQILGKETRTFRKVKNTYYKEPDLSPMICFQLLKQDDYLEEDTRVYKTKDHITILDYSYPGDNGPFPSPHRCNYMTT